MTQRSLARVFLGLPGLFILFTGLVFLTQPEAALAKLQLSAHGAEGLSNMRGLGGAPLVAVGASLLMSAVTANLTYARPGAIFLLVLLAARLLSHVLDGASGSLALFLTLPSVTFALMMVGHRLLDRSAAEPT